LHSVQDRLRNAYRPLPACIPVQALSRPFFVLENQRKYITKKTTQKSLLLMSALLKKFAAIVPERLLFLSCFKAGTCVHFLSESKKCHSTHIQDPLISVVSSPKQAVVCGGEGEAGNPCKSAALW
jgi:hypothetical protein